MKIFGEKKIILSRIKTVQAGASGGGGGAILYRIQHDWSLRTIEVMDQREKLGRFYCSLF